MPFKMHTIFFPEKKIKKEKYVCFPTLNFQTRYPIHTYFVILALPCYLQGLNPKILIQSMRKYRCVFQYRELRSTIFFARSQEGVSSQTK